MTIVQARETFFTAGRQVVMAGACFDSDHPTVQRWPHLFTSVESDVPMVESASAAPGEKRSARKPRRTKAQMEADAAAEANATADAPVAEVEAD